MLNVFITVKSLVFTRSFHPQIICFLITGWNSMLKVLIIVISLGLTCSFHPQII